MNPEDFTFDPNYHYDYFNNYYYDKTMGWSNCNDAYRIIEDNRILLNVNYIGVKTIYIERPNCEDLINIKELNPAVIVDNNLKTLANYADSFDNTEGKEKGKEITINNIEEIEGTDLYEVSRGFIALTPVGLDPTIRFSDMKTDKFFSDM